MSQQNISIEEWNTCIKVLQTLTKQPEGTFDITQLKSLVTKLYKNAKKTNKKNASKEILASKIYTTKGLSIEKIKKINNSQKAIKLYDDFLITQTQLFKNFDKTPTYSYVDNEEKVYRIKSKKCYQCKEQFKIVHFFYHLHCPNCANINLLKRTQTSNLIDRVCLVTGGRIKIGFTTALKLLRDGAKVWVTSRFPKDCLLRFQKEIDFDKWKNKLKVVSLDFRNIISVQNFITFFIQEETHLDILINNAAQTVKKPTVFYDNILEIEQFAHLDKNTMNCLAFNSKSSFIDFPINKKKISTNDINIYFPKNELDKDGQRIDKRNQNSWTLTLNSISTLELLETQLINVTVPFMLASQLKCLFLKSPFERKFIVNVSAMEGQFNRDSKTAFHPHTNMAKAALNMLTRTSAYEYAQSNIYMNSVDTGWITQENPYPKKERLFNEGFVPPLDEIDGMARIYDPIATGINNIEAPLFGHFLKDFIPHNW